MLWWSATVVWTWRYIFDKCNFKFCSLKSSDCCFSAVARSLNINFY